MKILTIFAIHTNTVQKVKTTLNNYNILKKFSDTIMFVDTSDYKDKISNLIDDKTNCKFLYKENDIYLDIGKWIYALDKSNYTHFDRIILVNDSILFIRDIPDFITMMENEYEIYGLNGSNEYLFHIQSYFRGFSVEGIKKLERYFYNNKDTVYSNGFPNHKAHGLKCYNELIHLIKIKGCKLNNVLDYCKELITHDFLNYNKCISISSIKNVNEIVPLCKKFHFDYLIRTGIISIFEIKIMSIFDTFVVLYSNTSSGNLNLQEDLCREYLIEKNYPLIKLKKLNNLKKTEGYISRHPLVKNLL